MGPNISSTYPASLSLFSFSSIIIKTAPKHPPSSATQPNPRSRRTTPPFQNPIFRCRRSESLSPPASTRWIEPSTRRFAPPPTPSRSSTRTPWTTRSSPSTPGNDTPSKNFISGFLDNKKEDHGLEQLMYLITFRMSWIIVEKNHLCHLEHHCNTSHKQHCMSLVFQSLQHLLVKQ